MPQATHPCDPAEFALHIAFSVGLAPVFALAVVVVLTWFIEGSKSVNLDDIRGRILESLFSAMIESCVVGLMVCGVRALV